MRAMQAFTSQPLSLQAGENPFSQPELLAALLVPHLEAYLSSNGSPSILILHFPDSYLSTILALRDLVGPQLFKVSGIIDSTAISPPSSSTKRPDSITSLGESVSAIASQSSSPILESRIPRISVMPRPSFSKADFLLPSPATDEEISTFLSTIQASLTFPPSSNVSDNASTPTSTLHPARSTNSMVSPIHHLPPPPHSIAPMLQQERASHTGAPKKVNFTSNMMSADISVEGTKRQGRQPERSWKNLESDCTEIFSETLWEKLESERRVCVSEKAWESFSLPYDDEEWEELERIFTPRIYMMRDVPQVGDSTKAHKWLGLD